MNSMPFISLIFQGIPEQIALTVLAFTIANAKMKWPKIVTIGTCLAIAAYLVRKLPVPFGLHTIILIILLFLFLVFWAKGDIAISFLGSTLGFLILIGYELVCVSTLIKIFNIDPDTLMTNLIPRILIFEPQVILLFLTAFLLEKYRKRGFIGKHESF
ncbi:hypothetical protein Desaci_3426 [Desulfosporosinus acidiphilus SJ4]|uniref:Uncharacterized protein n=2 Tax=Desulfosporosinus TaxID=79206 RepID=I4D942_DESAJ|nr:hypothetical protein [Desulfosporosinus acidiphilus]AFM42316.1 hypothetical protein Desaci_3426 [Desulfosporosinus acidiphilus SJ4]